MYGQDRNQIRQVYCNAWQKFSKKEPLEALEQQLVDIIRLHPEYHSLLDNPDKAMEKDYLPEAGETNPFLHMGLHMAIHEQLATDRPAGIRSAYQQLLSQYKDSHELEHKVMECLAEMIWQAQKTGGTADENRYLQCIRKLTQ
ncbi:MAG: DUF1841 family protein [Gammaproteobacteria bacterium]